MLMGENGQNIRPIGAGERWSLLFDCPEKREDLSVLCRVEHDAIMKSIFYSNRLRSM